MGRNTPHARRILEWDTVETEEEWVESTWPAAVETPGPVRPKRLPMIAFAASLSFAMIGILVCSLWRAAEAGIVATEQHIGTLVKIEILRQQNLEAYGKMSADVQSLELKGDVALVHVVVTETSPVNLVSSYVETRFYHRSSAGWARTKPIPAYWGRKSTLDTVRLHIDFYELDRPSVEAVITPADDFHRALWMFLGLPQAVADPMTITVAPRYVIPAESPPAGTIVVVSPLLLRRSVDADAATMLSTELRTQLIAHAMRESQAYYRVRPEWDEVIQHFAGWLGEHADTLSALDDRSAPIRPEAASPQPRPLRMALLADNTADYGSGGYAGYRSQSTAYATHAFFDWLIAERGPDAVPALFAAFGAEDDWPGVLQAVFGVSVDDLDIDADEAPYGSHAMP